MFRPMRRKKKGISTETAKQLLLHGRRNSRINIELTDPEADVTIYPISIQPPVMEKTGWTIEECNSIITDEVENASSMDIPDNLLDNNKYLLDFLS